MSEQKGVNIWKGNTSKDFLETNNLSYKEGMMGPMYGYQWRFFNSNYTLRNNKCNNLDKYKQYIFWIYLF